MGTDYLGLGSIVFCLVLRENKSLGSILWSIFFPTEISLIVIGIFQNLSETLSSTQIYSKLHFEHLITNGVHKQYFFENISLHWITTKRNVITEKIDSYIPKSLRIFFLENIFFLNFGAFGIFYTPRNLIFGFTSSKSHFLPLLIKALEFKKKQRKNIVDQYQ